MKFQMSILMRDAVYGGYRANDIRGGTSPGKQNADDPSTIDFTKEDVEHDLGDVIETMQTQAAEANRRIVRQAMHARYASRLYFDQGTKLFVATFNIDEMLTRPEGSERQWTAGGWKRVEFVGALVRLRAWQRPLSEVLEVEARRRNCLSGGSHWKDGCTTKSSTKRMITY